MVQADVITITKQEYARLRDVEKAYQALLKNISSGIKNLEEDEE